MILYAYVFHNGIKVFVSETLQPKVINLLSSGKQ